MTSIDLRTDAEIARDRKHQSICADFIAVSAKHKDAAPSRIANALARKYSMSVPGIINILVDNKLYVKNRKRRRNKNNI